VAAVSQARQLFYQNDTFGGMSGSPIWLDKDGPYLIGIHAYGPHGRAPHSLHNHGTRITKAVFNNLVSWINQ
jgi:glutamyl endopeptidase